MEKPPVIISTKDLSYICDIFNWNYTTCKLAHDFSLKVNDEELKDFICDISKMHKDICEDLISMIYLEEHYEQ